MQGLGRGVVYVSRRAGNKGDTNGKSGNINSWARQLYPVVRVLAPEPPPQGIAMLACR